MADGAQRAESHPFGPRNASASPPGGDTAYSRTAKGGRRASSSEALRGDAGVPTDLPRRLSDKENHQSWVSFEDEGLGETESCLFSPRGAGGASSGAGAAAVGASTPPVVPPQVPVIPFSRPLVTPRDALYAHDVLHNVGFGSNKYSNLAIRLLQDMHGGCQALLTQSCTTALEMCGLLAGLSPGDEVLMPSYTYVSTANAFVMRGAVPVFVDVRADTLNLDESKLAEALTDRTRAVCVVHYAGVACEMDAILAFAAAHSLLVIEDAAHAVCAGYKGRPLGTLGHMGALSFHHTKNLSCGEGGALLLPRGPSEAEGPAEGGGGGGVGGGLPAWLGTTRAALAERARTCFYNGTDRALFLEKKVASYEWIDLGSSFWTSELTAALCAAQLEERDAITQSRLLVWNALFAGSEGLEREGLVRRPVVPVECWHNAHIFYLLTRGGACSTVLLNGLKARGVGASRHYTPLHSAPAGRRFGRVGARDGRLPVTEAVAEGIVRLPVWADMDGLTLSAILQALHGAAADLREFMNLGIAGSPHSITTCLSEDVASSLSAIHASPRDAEAPPAEAVRE